jgi:Protein of unknown function (DUF2726)
MNQSQGSNPLVTEPLPDAPWPVAARNLLSAREQSLYQRLLSLYPKHQVFVQVALSQLIDVDRNYPESESIRARYKQLVADFVLCRADLSVVAVIELDDRSHERRDRQDADARKTKALVDAGLRLVRIPAGELPSEEELREIIDADRASLGERLEIPKIQHFVAPEPELRLAPDWGSAPTFAPRADHEGAASRAVKGRGGENGAGRPRLGLWVGCLYTARAGGGATSLPAVNCSARAAFIDGATFVAGAGLCANYGRARCCWCVSAGIGGEEAL